MDLTSSFEFPPGFEHATGQLTNSEASKMLGQAGRKLIKRERLFKKHFQDGQSSFPENEPSYRSRKAKRTGATEKFVYSGSAKAALTGETAPMFVRVNGQRRTLMIYLRKMVKGVNVYKVAQVGKFKGVQLRTQGGKNFTLTAAQTFEHNRKRTRAFHALQRAGKLTGVSRRDFDARFGKTVRRFGSKEMPITANLPGDEPIVIPVVAEEIAITMQKRGL